MPTLKRIFCFVAALGLFANGWAATPRPNILFIYTDDQGPWTTGYSGSPDAHTPNMDRLRREGADLVNSFTVSPVCSPSRAGLITGRYASEFGIFDWINSRVEPQLGLSRDAVTWPQLLETAGYQTGLVGKWHLGIQSHFHPTKFGYGYFMGILEGGTRPKDPTLEKDGKMGVIKGLCVDILTDHALGFIQGRKADRWALSLHYRAPHAAYLPVAPEVWKRFEKRDVTLTDYPDLDVKMMTQVMREYLASIADIDRNIGRVLGLLDKLGLADSTLVIFSSDHGYNVGHHGLQYKGNALWRLRSLGPKQWPFIHPKRRPNMFDTSTKVPTVVRWPGIVTAGSTITNSVSNLDWFSTLCEVGGAAIPKGVPQRGRSIVPLLRGGAEKWNDEVYFEYSMHHGSTVAMRAVRTPDWKLMRDFRNAGRAELYDLKNDPGETHNLIGSSNAKHRRIARELDRKIGAKMIEVNDPEQHRYRPL
jgi:choline-sulfatase